MSQERHLRLDRFEFHELHPNVRIGTASDRYAG